MARNGKKTKPAKEVAKAPAAKKKAVGPRLSQYRKTKAEPTTAAPPVQTTSAPPQSPELVKASHMKTSQLHIANAAAQQYIDVDVPALSVGQFIVEVILLTLGTFGLRPWHGVRRGAERPNVTTSGVLGRIIASNSDSHNEGDIVAVYSPQSPAQHLLLSDATPLLFKVPGISRRYMYAALSAFADLVKLRVQQLCSERLGGTPRSIVIVGNTAVARILSSMLNGAVHYTSPHLRHLDGTFDVALDCRVNAGIENLAPYLNHNGIYLRCLPGESGAGDPAEFEYAGNSILHGAVSVDDESYADLLTARIAQKQAEPLAEGVTTVATFDSVVTAFGAPTMNVLLTVPQKK